MVAQLHPLEQKAVMLHDSIALLEQERDRLAQEGLAPEGAWIECGKVQGREFRQAWWRSLKPMFTAKRSRGNVEAKTKSSYIGKEGSASHKRAIESYQRRKRYEQVCKQIEILEEGL